MNSTARVQTKLLLVAALLLIVSTALASYFALGQFENEISPALDKKAQVIGEPIVRLLVKMNKFDVPYSQMRGLDDVFNNIGSDNQEIAYLEISDQNDTPVYHWLRKKTSTALANANPTYEVSTGKGEVKGSNNKIFKNITIAKIPVMTESGDSLGFVKVGQFKDIMKSRMQEIIADIITVVVVSGLMALELLIFLTTFTVSAPINALKQIMIRVKGGDLTQQIQIGSMDEVGRLSILLNQSIGALNDKFDLVNESIKEKSTELKEKINALTNKYQFCGNKSPHELFAQKLIYIRPPLFLLIFAESMSLSFFPMFVDSLYTPIADIPKSVVIGLPISIFMLIWALSLPFAGQWSDQVGRRKTFMVGAILTSVGLILTAFSADIFQMVLWRCLTAVGYGIVFITAQGYVTDNTNPENRTKGMAMFLSGFFSGSLCGAAIGGILADRIGYQATFLLSAVLSVGAAIFVYRFLLERTKADDEVEVKPKLKFSDFITLYTNKYFLAITFLAAIPAKVALTGFLYFTGPLYLEALGTSQSSAGRILMAYGLAIIIISPLAAWVVDYVKQRKPFVIVGGFLSGAALLLVYATDSLAGMLAGVALLGIAHAVGISPQLSLITEVVTKTTDLSTGKIIGIFRLTERIGNISGPLIAGLLISHIGFSGVFFGLGVFTLCSISLFTVFYAVFTWRDKSNETHIENMATV